MKRIQYWIGIIISVILGIMSMTVLGNTKILGPTLIVYSIYLLIGCCIKLCRMNEQLRHTVICAIDLLWWLP